MKPCNKPCPECPFRKKSLPGYIGGHEDVTEITDTVYYDGKFPCHMQVNAIKAHLLKVFEDKDDCLTFTDHGAFEQAHREAPVCAGSAIFLNNDLKLSRHKDVHAMQQLVAEESDDVFSSREEMISYHRGGFNSIKLPIEKDKEGGDTKMATKKAKKATVKRGAKKTAVKTAKTTKRAAK